MLAGQRDVIEAIAAPVLASSARTDVKAKLQFAVIASFGSGSIRHGRARSARPPEAVEPDDEEVPARMKTVVQYVVAGTATLALAGTGFAADVLVYPPEGPVRGAAEQGFLGVLQRNRKEGTMHRIMLGVVAFAWMGIVSSPGVAAAKEKPAATLKLSGKSVAAGVGISWGKGTLNYKGKQHPFSIDGLSVADVGVSSIDATGNVYHLKKLEDFEGQYTAASAGAAVAGGAGVSTMKNANGVVINLHAMTRGVKFKLGVDGVKIKLEE